MRPMIILLVALSSLCYSCKSDTAKYKTADPQGTLSSGHYLMTNQIGIAPVEIETMRKSAADVLAFRKKESNNKSYTILDKDVWVFGGYVSDTGSLFADSLGGAWMDFKENLTYEYGQYDKKGGGGHYFYNFDNATLLILDDNPALKPQEFEVKIREDMVVLVGSRIYKDNNIQAMLERKIAIPTKTMPVDTTK